ncbi:hypothetical protein [Pectinatus haikarae]|uniref:Uncharacterized protein n=1 Tax=Pectinatus haikarae TaxID=349096 RepID=A0ABT9Y5P6_9FIRM|nr:hypothetical protein [Pectinatus haikarae]MDQ0202512.1 hypothetical protein [Pectinatus haikarae]
MDENKKSLEAVEITSRDCKSEDNIEIYLAGRNIRLVDVTRRLDAINTSNFTQQPVDVQLSELKKIISDLGLCVRALLISQFPNKPV